MRVPVAILVPLCLATAPGPVPAAAPADAAKLEATVVDGSLDAAARVKAADALSRADPERLGEALLSLGRKRKDPVHLGFLVAYTVSEEVPHFRLLSTWAAWQTDPGTVVAAFEERLGAKEEKESIRAAEALGHLAPQFKDREIYGRLLEFARKGRPLEAIAAVEGVVRASDKRLLKDLLDAAAQVPDDHVRKHVAWGILDLLGQRNAIKQLEVLKRRPGEEGRNANEAVEILLDGKGQLGTWDPGALGGVPAWWERGRPAKRRTTMDIGDDETRKKMEGFLEEMDKSSPAWSHLVGSTIHRVALRTKQAPEIFDPKTKTLSLDASEILRCETPWQGSYVLSRDACIGLRAIFGAPQAGHRGWEPAYVEMHSFYRTTGHGGGELAEFVDRAVDAKPWP